MLLSSPSFEDSASLSEFIGTSSNPLEAGEGKETDSPIQPPKGTSPVNTLTQWNSFYF